ncbi:DUF2147 domain-containing protein [Algoriphagus sp.]|uniref:DUF2147 domain-containing protein n=1 Tax=Algoriphagus sp. TaxID=1872435 RepID=UPI0025F6F625|nr:DUF2147 domain-containing protein [Algoriphagus sp.]
MKYCHFASLLFIVLVLSFFDTNAQSDSRILGKWLNTEETAQIEIMNKDGKFLGKIIWLDNPNKDGTPVLDKANENEKLRNRPVMGLTILEGLKYDDGIWKGGKIYDPNSGKTYSCELKLKGQEKLEVKGYLGFSWIGKTVEWTKVKK